MDQTLDNISNSLYNGQLPNDWRKLAPATCMQLGAWINHLLVSDICLTIASNANYLSVKQFLYPFRVMCLVVVVFFKLIQIEKLAPKQAIQILVSIGRTSSHVVIWLTCTRKLHNSPRTGIPLQLYYGSAKKYKKLILGSLSKELMATGSVYIVHVSNNLRK